MIEELLGRIRGTDRWTETSANVISTDRFIPESWQRGPSEATVVFCYTPDGGEIQSGEFRVDDGCSLFNLEESDTFPIRYDPAHPERHFCSEYSIRSRLKFLGLLVVGFVAVFIYVFASVLRR